MSIVIIDASLIHTKIVHLIANVRNEYNRVYLMLNLYIKKSEVCTYKLRLSALEVVTAKSSDRYFILRR